VLERHEIFGAVVLSPVGLAHAPPATMRTSPTTPTTPTTIVDHTDDIAQRDARTKRSLLPFALLILVVAAIWLAFTRYV